MKNYIYIIIILILTSNITFAQNQHIIWIGGMKGTTAQNILVVERATTIIKGLIKKGVSPKNIILHTSAGSDTPVSKPRKILNAIHVLGINKYYTNVSDSLTEYFKDNDIKIPPKNVRDGTMKHLEKTFQEVGKKTSASGGNVFVYTTTVKEARIGSSVWDLAHQHNSLYSYETNSGDYVRSNQKQKSGKSKASDIQNIMRSQIIKFQRMEETINKIQNNPEFMKDMNNLTTLRIKLLADNPALYNEFARNMDDIYRIRKLIHLSPEERQKYYDNQNKKLYLAEMDAFHHKPPIHYGKKDLSRLFSEFRKYNRDSKIFVLNDLSNPMTYIGQVGVCEYQSILSSDKHGGVQTSAFVDGLIKGNVRDAIINTEEAKRKNHKKYGQYGEITIDKYLTYLRKKYNDIVIANDPEHQVTNISVTCINKYIDRKMGSTNETDQLITISQIPLKVDQKKLKTMILKFQGEYTVFPDYGKYKFIDYLSAKEAKRVKDIIECLSLQF